MGTNNRQRRAAKKKARERAGRPGMTQSRDVFVEDAGWAPPEVNTAGEAIWTAASALARTGGDSAEYTRELTEGVLGGFPQVVDLAMELVMRRAIGHLWRGGWLPYDVVRIVDKQLGAVAATLVTDMIAAETAQYAKAGLHERWHEQLGQIEASVWWRTDDAHLGQWQARQRQDRIAALAASIGILATTMNLPRLPVIVPLPGTATTTGARHHHVDPKILTRVRGLLAKAESTQFPEEAEAFSAKAQELMNRHAFERALLDADEHAPQSASSRRVWLDAPYVGAKAQLVHVVAEANRCRAVVYEKLGFVALLGDELDLEITELLTTSLLLQATRALVSTDRETARTGLVRSYRQSFLLAYATRIGERLRAVTDASIVDDRLLPVLADRSKAVDELFVTMFPDTVTKSYSVRNEAGWGAGTAAADHADLDLNRTALR
ncbi:MAG TPA: DUF2786 domain-containing protein [Pseudonocardiaceae bacterium]|nr:DUF2786 domain-containing protein [Pseudonocardiaceae bacterium]